MRKKTKLIIETVNNGFLVREVLPEGQIFLHFFDEDEENYVEKFHQYVLDIILDITGEWGDVLEVKWIADYTPDK